MANKKVNIVYKRLDKKDKINCLLLTKAYLLKMS